MNKKEKKNGLLSSLKKGKELWESHGEKITNVVKKGKELWDTHGEELTDAVKKAIPAKGKKIDLPVDFRVTLHPESPSFFHV